jgi:ribosomal protein S5
MRDKRRRQRQKTINDVQGDEIKVFNVDQLTMESHADETMNFNVVQRRRVQKVHSTGKREFNFVVLFI